MTETWIEGGMFTIMTLISVAIAFILSRNARAHERSARAFDAKLEQAGINLKG